jgi:hypothetical protein
VIICNRCGVVNRAGRVACVQCLARLDATTAGLETVRCVNHPDVPAVGKCVTCGIFVCDTCGGVINNRAVYCVDHAAMAMMPAAAPGGKAPKAPKEPKPPKPPKQPKPRGKTPEPAA